MKDYIYKILRPDILPNWIGIIGVILSSIALFILVNEKSIESNASNIRSDVLELLDTSGVALTANDVYKVLKNKRYKKRNVNNELYGLMAEKILLRTSDGFEINRYNTRLYNEIDLIISHIYPKCNNHNKEKCGIAFEDIEVGVLEVKCQLKEIESIRNKEQYSKVKQSFIDYLDKIDWYIRERFYFNESILKTDKFNIIKSKNFIQATDYNCEKRKSK